MTIQQAIEKTIEGGWRIGALKPKNVRVKYWGTGLVDILWDDKEQRLGGEIRNITLGTIFIDPLFWQSLGKAMGWPTDICKNCGEVNRCLCGGEAFVPGWEYNWLLFIHNLAEGKVAESFFESL